MDLFKIEELLFAEDGACMCENETVAIQKMKEAMDLLGKIDSANLTVDAYIDLANIIIHYSVFSMSKCGKIAQYGEVLAQMYQMAIDSPFYEERV